MKKIIVYGYGRKYRKLKNEITGCEIIAFADKNANELSCDELDVHIILPEEISNYEYDYVAISVIGAFEQIKQQLIGENGVSEDKIISLMLFAESNRPNLNEYERLLNDSNKIMYGQEHSLMSYGKCPEDEPKGRRYSLSDALIIDEDAGTVNEKHFIMTEENRGKEDVRIYVVTHLDYNVLADDVYTPITVGAYTKEGFLSEHDGINISHLNSKINENTAIYWIWKNSDADIVGTNHYRRYFYNNEFRCRENKLSGEMARKYLEDYDIIVYKGRVPNGATIKEEMLSDLPRDVFDYGYRVITDCLKEYQPDYLEDFYDVMESKECFYCNMLVTRKELFDRYCKWLFSFLIPAAESSDVSDYNSHDARIIGFFAERMLTVWLHHNPMKIKDLPVFIP